MDIPAPWDSPELLEKTKMREIKFRVWNGEILSEPFCPWDLVDDAYGGLMDKNGCSVWWDEDGFRGENWMQYTGLKDKNGKEIYEGDVAIMFKQERWQPQYPHEVYFGHGGFSLRTLKTGYYCAGVCHYTDDRIEVIGNKWDNPDLLK